ncbi:DUF1501 domain-containing protein [Luteolibacter flavescens]|uniref:DUF1501 domain-containing protein n=1 Tax=Luteolibacter flavescens TaxID=1859460 RepID=A0ABT3FN96_9BACT|nr:DUF1501 domain-containing protein [Luteolibacter flavescens]MCW1885039.1 DUF1501 domain-containing protein [Luteolibacter flavescens]
MPPKDLLKFYSRRGFLSHAARAGVGSLAASALMRDLNLINTASAQGPLDDISDYKALCCIFLAGGNDSDNTIIDTRSTPYQNYKDIRNLLAIKTGLEPLTVPISGSDPVIHPFALHPALGTAAGGGGIKKLFEEKKAAVLFNVGPLVRPVIKAEYLAGTAALPPQLYSHSDQTTHWQTSWPDEPPKTGWAGRMGDWLLNGVEDVGQLASLNISVSGTNTFQRGEHFHPFSVASKGAVTLTDGLPIGPATPEGPQRYEWLGGWHQALGKIVEIPTPENMQRSAYAGVLGNAIASGVNVNQALDDTVEVGERCTDGSPGEWVWDIAWPSGSPWTGLGFPRTSLGGQLKMVARMIAARVALGMSKRQTFFVQLGGFDTHADQVFSGNPSVGTHAQLLTELSDAVFAFQRALEQLGVMGDHLGIQNKVVSFTASDFGRTFRSNGLGSDHGWGAHHFIFGGNGEATSALDGGKTYGAFPNQFLGSSPDDAGGGRWIPTTSVDAYSATLGRWFGVSEEGLNLIFPNLTHFSNRNLGFMRTT